MEIAEEEDLARFLRLFHHQFCVVVYWIQLGARAYPLPVQVLADKRAPIVADDDAVRIEHRYDLEHERVS